MVITDKYGNIINVSMVAKVEHEPEELRLALNSLIVEHKQLEQENAELRAAVEILREDLMSFSCQFKNDVIAQKYHMGDSLNKTNEQHLNDVRAEAVEEMVSKLDKTLLQKATIMKYAQQLRGGE